MSTALKEMNDVINQLTCFLQNEYIQEPAQILPSSTANAEASLNCENNCNKVPNNSEIHNALNEVYPEVNKIANNSFEFPPLEDDSPRSITNCKDEIKNYQTKGNEHICKLNTDGCCSRNNGIYRICKDKNFGFNDKQFRTNATCVTIDDQINTVKRLYETQAVYDRKLEIYKFLAAQNEVRFNKEKPDIDIKTI